MKALEINQNDFIIEKFEDSDITFAIKEDLWLNATQVAKEYGKRMDNYWRDDSAYIDELCNLSSLNMSDLKQVVTGKGKEQGTYIHPDLVVSFARWINPKFAIWCNTIIKKIIKDDYNDEINKLMAEAKQCNMYDDGFTSVRGLTQHIPDFEHTERSFKENLAKADYIRPVYKRVKTWELTKRGEASGFIRYDNHGTLLYDSNNLDKIVHVSEKVKELPSNALTIHTYNGFTGEYHCSFPTLKTAERELGVTGISGILNGSRGNGKQHIRGICFRVGDDKPESIEPLKNTKKIFREINVFKNNVFIETHRTLANAGKVAGVGQTTVKRCLQNDKETKNGYSFAYAELSFTGRK